VNNVLALMDVKLFAEELFKLAEDLQLIIVAGW
jgi:hypothetical protein